MFDTLIITDYSPKDQGKKRTFSDTMALQQCTPKKQRKGREVDDDLDKPVL